VSELNPLPLCVSASAHVFVLPAGARWDESQRDRLIAQAVLSPCGLWVSDWSAFAIAVVAVVWAACCYRFARRRFSLIRFELAHGELRIRELPVRFFSNGFTRKTAAS
jgi:hypothetical protein